jgi:hypothetical protein
MKDFDIINNGSFFLLQPLTEKADIFSQDNFPKNNDHTYLQAALIVEHRYIDDICDLFTENDLAVE